MSKNKKEPALIDINEYITRDKVKDLIKVKSVFIVIGIIALVIILAVTIALLIYFFN